MGDINLEVMGEYGEVKYSPKLEDAENPASDMMYGRVVEMDKARKGIRGVGGVGGGSKAHN